MDAVAIIKALDVIEDRQLRLFSCVEVMMMHPLILQVGEAIYRDGATFFSKITGTVPKVF